MVTWSLSNHPLKAHYDFEIQTWPILQDLFCTHAYKLAHRVTRLLKLRAFCFSRGMQRLEIPPLHASTCRKSILLQIKANVIAGTHRHPHLLGPLPQPLLQLRWCLLQCYRQCHPRPHLKAPPFVGSLTPILS